MAPHQTWSRRLRPVIPTLVVALLAATGCSGGGSSSGPEAPPAVFPATVTHEYGQTVVEEAPERVVSLGYTDQDAILALGTVPVAIREFTGNRPSATWPWATDKLKGEQPQVLPAGDVTPDAVAALEPDLIVAITANLTREQYDAFSKIAPTVAAPVGVKDGLVPWSDATKLTGAALGLPAEADRIVSDVEEKFVEVEENHPELAGATVAMAVPNPADPASVKAWSSNDLRGQFLKELGVQVPAQVDRLAGDGTFATMPSDQLPTLDDADALMVAGTPAEQAAFAALPGYGQLKLVQESKVVTLDDEQSAALAFGSVLSLPAVADEVAGGWPGPWAARGAAGPSSRPAGRVHPAPPADRHHQRGPRDRVRDHARVEAEHVAQQVFGEHLVRGSRRHDPAGPHRDQAARVARGEVEVVQHHHDRAAHLAVQALDEIEHVDLVGEVEVRGRLVEQDHVGALRERHRDPRTLALAAGELIQRPGGELGHPGPGEGLADGRSRRPSTTAGTTSGGGAGRGRRDRPR